MSERSSLVTPLGYGFLPAKVPSPPPKLTPLGQKPTEIDTAGTEINGIRRRGNENEQKQTPRGRESTKTHAAGTEIYKFHAAETIIHGEPMPRDRK